MKHISRALQSRLAKKNMSKLSIGAFLVNQATIYLQYPNQCSGYIRNNILFLKLDHREDKTALFVQKKHMIEHMNQRLNKLGYQYVVKDLRFK